MRALKIAASGLVSVIGVLSSVSSTAHGAWVPPAGYERVGGTITGQLIAVAPDGKVADGINKVGSTPGSVQIYADAAAAAAGTSPIRTFTDPSFVSFGDLTFDGSNTILFSEFSNGTVYSGSVASGGAATALAPANSVQFPQGVAVRNGTVYATSVVGPGASDILALSGGAATPVVSNVGVGYIGGLAFDAAGNLLVTDSNDPDFTGDPGRLLRFDSAFNPLTPIVLNDGAGAGVHAYDLAIDSEGDIFVSTGPTLTRLSSDFSVIEQFGPTFAGGFEFVAGLDFVGSGFEANAGSGRLFINATDAGENGIIVVAPVPEPAALGLLAFALVALTRKRRKSAVAIAASLCAFASVVSLSNDARADQFFATEIVARTIGTSQQPQFTDPALALGAPRGGGTTTNSLDVYCLGNGGSLTLGFNLPDTSRAIVDAPGRDFIVSENSFYQDEDTTRAFAELMWVEVSTNGVDFARFAAHSRTPSPVGPFGVIDPADTKGFAGALPVLANVDANTIDPFDLATAGGDSFDLQWLVAEPNVVSGAVRLDDIRFVRFVDVIGNGSSLDSSGRPLYDPTGPGIGGADVDAVAVLHGVTTPTSGGGVNAPEPSSTAAALSSAAAVASLCRHKRT